MSEHTLRPIWTPDDYQQTARDAAQQRAAEYQAQAALYASDPVGPIHINEAVATTTRYSADPARGRHRAPTVLGMRPRRAARIARLAIAVAVVVLVVALGALWASQRAGAEPDRPYPYPVHCVDEFWLIPVQATRRAICDGPIQPDGSWTRLREFLHAGSLRPAARDVPAADVARHRPVPSRPVERARRRARTHRMIRALFYRGRHHLRAALLARPFDERPRVTVSVIAARLRREAREAALASALIGVGRTIEMFAGATA